MPVKKTINSSSNFSSSSDSNFTSCNARPIIKQNFGTCWFNALLTCLLYGDKSKKLLKHIFKKLNKTGFDKLIKHNFREMIEYMIKNKTIKWSLLQNRQDILINRYRLTSL